MIQYDIVFDESLGKAGENIKRRYTADEALDLVKRGKLTAGSRARLATECWMNIPGMKETEKESSARRTIAKYSPTPERSIEDAISKAGDDCVVVIEPLQDWLVLKNLLTLFLPMQSYLTGEHALDKAKVLEKCGFEYHNDIRLFGPVKSLDSFYGAYVAPIAFNSLWRNDSFMKLLSEGLSEEPNPFNHESYIRWSQYIEVGFEAKKTKAGTTTYYRLISDKEPLEHGEIRRISFNELSSDPKSLLHYKENWGGNLYLAYVSDGTDPWDDAVDLFNTFANNRIAFSNCRVSFGVEGAAKGFVSTTLAGQLWLCMFGRKDLRVDVCEHCGIPYFATKNSRKKFCSTLCSHAD
jgi:hypothetical protein